MKRTSKLVASACALMVGAAVGLEVGNAGTVRQVGRTEASAIVGSACYLFLQNDPRDWCGGNGCTPQYSGRVFTPGATALGWYACYPGEEWPCLYPDPVGTCG